MKLLEFGDQAHRLWGVPVAAAAPVQELSFKLFFVVEIFSSTIFVRLSPRQFFLL